MRQFSDVITEAVQRRPGQPPINTIVLFDHTAKHTAAPAAQLLGVIGIIVTAFVNHERMLLHV